MSCRDQRDVWCKLLRTFLTTASFIKSGDHIEGETCLMGEAYLPGEIVAKRGRVMPAWRSCRDDLDRLVFPDWVLSFSLFNENSFPVTGILMDFLGHGDRAPEEDLDFINSVDTLVAPKVADLLGGIWESLPDTVAVFCVSGFLTIRKFFDRYCQRKYDDRKFMLWVLSGVDPDNEAMPPAQAFALECANMRQLRTAMREYWSQGAGAYVYLVPEKNAERILAPKSVPLSADFFKAAVLACHCSFFGFDHNARVVVMTPDAALSETVSGLASLPEQEP
jgi:hypothetical protein